MLSFRSPDGFQRRKGRLLFFASGPVRDSGWAGIRCCSFLFQPGPCRRTRKPAPGHVVGGTGITPRHRGAGRGNRSRPVQEAAEGAEPGGQTGA